MVVGMLCSHRFYIVLRYSIKPLCAQDSIPRTLHTAGFPLYRFSEHNPKGDYYDPKDEERFWKEQRASLYGLKDGFKDLRTEIVRWKDEWKERITDDSRCFIFHGDRTPVWKFSSPDDIKKTWITVSDSENNEGFSRCELTMSPTGKGIFHGFVNTRLPQDGKTRKAGYCSMKSHRVTKSFHRDAYLEWESYTHLIMRVRGDGRCYNINISTAGFFDITWNDMYHYVLFTRGGPYWQFVKIPFSKFVFGSKGRVQDMQNRIPLNRVTSIGITCGNVDGPFSLEIDWIGVECDQNNPEEFAYETYRIPPFIANV